MERKVNIIRDADGNKIVIINDIRFKGRRSINWNDVKEYLTEFVGEFYTIAETEDVIYIGSDFPDEYTGSKYTYTLKGTVAKAKANAAQGIPEIIEIAKGKQFNVKLFFQFLYGVTDRRLRDVELICGLRQTLHFRSDNKDAKGIV